ncbi:protein of unknown function [Bartonella clarridgeiae 73]|uniref:Uncharacterized protein n=1 Tax=Bartonella clarridgeiae (strain CCUG 45776 / CIP 104772 / 73) TaxID=696125 RepID=E6YJH9_BARC7|nr:protein of unknown function [Bartonella clarridgeiae 73]
MVSLFCLIIFRQNITKSAIPKLNTEESLSNTKLFPVSSTTTNSLLTGLFV